MYSSYRLLCYLSTIRKFFSMLGTNSSSKASYWLFKSCTFAIVMVFSLAKLNHFQLHWLSFLFIRLKHGGSFFTDDIEMTWINELLWRDVLWQGISKELIFFWFLDLCFVSPFSGLPPCWGVQPDTVDGPEVDRYSLVTYQGRPLLVLYYDIKTLNSS